MQWSSLVFVARSPGILGCLCSVFTLYVASSNQLPLWLVLGPAFSRAATELACPPLIVAHLKMNTVGCLFIESVSHNKACSHRVTSVLSRTFLRGSLSPYLVASKCQARLHCVKPGPLGAVRAGVSSWFGTGRVVAFNSLLRRREVRRSDKQEFHSGPRDVLPSAQNLPCEELPLPRSPSVNRGGSVSSWKHGASWGRGRRTADCSQSDLEGARGD